ncbi:hypothetical protein HYZ80_01845 [Candidatus Parcubacteria bacterium]|nr:hypothetical protein [Candidatus Parcubacteria bacterium]
MIDLREKLSENLIIPSEPPDESLLSSGASDGISGNAPTFLIIFVLASFAFMSILGMDMSMKPKDDQMSGCPFMAGQATMCQMGVTEHIAKWQQAFLGIPTKTNFLAFAAVLLIAILASLIKPFPQLKKLTASTARFLAYHKASCIKVFDPLLIAFSDGILNPKIYEPAHI